MKIGLINEDSQADKNAMIFDILKQEAEKKDIRYSITVCIRNRIVIRLILRR